MELVVLFSTIQITGKEVLVFRRNTDWNCLSWSRKTVATCLSYPTTGGPSKESTTNKLPPTGKNSGKVKRREEMPVSMSDRPPRTLTGTTLAERCMSHQEGPWVRTTGHRQLGNYSHLHKAQDCKLHGRAAVLGSLTLLRSTRVPFPIKSLALSVCQHVCLLGRLISVLDKSPPQALQRVPFPATWGSVWGSRA